MAGARPFVLDGLASLLVCACLRQVPSVYQLRHHVNSSGPPGYSLVATSVARVLYLDRRAGAGEEADQEQQDDGADEGDEDAPEVEARHTRTAHQREHDATDDATDDAHDDVTTEAEP